MASGIRYDMILADRQNGLRYLRELVRHHVSGQMKIAPEHSEEQVLPGWASRAATSFSAFRELFQLAKPGRKGRSSS